MRGGDQILIQDRVGRVRTPRERRDAMVEEYERRGMSVLAFAEHVGMKYPTLASWIQKKRRQAQREASTERGKHRERQAQREANLAVKSHPVQWVGAMPDIEEQGRGLQIRLVGGVVRER
jgi:transposase-like protein